MKLQNKTLLMTLPANRRERNPTLGFVLCAICTTAWAATIAGMLLLPCWLSILAAFANGIAVAMLFIVGHDAAHGSLFFSRPLNCAVATLAFLPALHPLSSWTKSHNGMHHKWTNLKGEDPGYAPLSLDEYRRLPFVKRQMQRCYRTSLGMGLFYFAEVYCKFEMFPSREHRPSDQRQFLRDRLVVAAFLIAECVGIYYLAVAARQTLPILFTVYAIAVPYSVFLWLIGLVTYSHHTHPAIPWFDRKDEWSFFQGQVAGTTHVEFPHFFDIVLLNILEHSAHHLDPLIPLYHLPKSQVALEDAFPGSIQIIPWTSNVFWTTLCCCKLYDYQKHCWLDFNGRPTTPRLVSIDLPPESTDLAEVDADSFDRNRLSTCGDRRAAF